MRRRVIPFLAAVAGAVAAYAFVVRPSHLRWGATPEEVGGRLAGDELVPDPDLVATRAISIRAPASEVWPWIAQMGQGRGGLYSYDALENLVACDIHSADHIVASWQAVSVGDAFLLHPEVALRVAALEAGRAPVIRGGAPMGDTPPPYDFTWAFQLRERFDGVTRLVVRERYGYTERWSPCRRNRP